MDLGARAFDVLAVLLTRPNEIFSKRDLLARVWPDSVVDESSLRFQIASLRNALGDGRHDARYIGTIAGGCYCFVAPVSRSNEPQAESSVISAGVLHPALPNRLSRLWADEGRTSEAQALLHPVVERFLESDETAHLKVARRLLASLS